MKKKHLLFVLLISHFVFSQSPGGLNNVIYWLTPSETANSEKTSSTINFNPTIFVNEKNILEKIDFSDDLKDISVFVVLKPAFLQEKYQLIDIHSNDNQIAILSDRIKSTKELKIKNFASEKPYFFSYLESYDEGKEKNSADLINKNNLSKFEGYIAEMIIYPKLLSRLERRKVETYLSLKYGISLPVNSDYINSKNDTIWKKNESKSFLYRVSGIGLDIDANLNQKQSSNVDDYQFLTIGLGNKIETKNELNKENWDNLNYILWADNGGSLNFEEEKNTTDVSILNRVWKTKTIGDYTSQKFLTFSFDPNLFEFDNKNEKTENDDLKYWVVFATDSSEKLDIQSAEFIKSVKMPENGDKIEFSNIPLKNQTESFLFTLVKAPELFALIDTTEKNCQSDAHLKIIGGIAPYTIEIYSEENQKFPIIEKGENQFDIPNLVGGNYICKITDALNQKFEQPFHISSDTQGAFTIENIYLKNGEIHTLDLYKLQNNTISEIVWLKDDQEISRGNQFTVKEEGVYSIKYLTEKGCQQSTLFTATKTPTAEWLGIYPNPVQVNESFFVNLNNKASSQVQVTITDYSGRIVKTKTMKSGSDIYSDSFYHQGTYIITVETKTEKNQYTLIVK